MKVEVIGLRLLMEMAILRGGGVRRPGTGLALMESSSIAELQRVGGLRPISFVEERCCYSSFLGVREAVADVGRTARLACRVTGESSMVEQKRERGYT